MENHTDVDADENAEYSTKSSIFGAAFNFINSIVGAGIIGLPYAIRISGPIPGFLLLVLVTVIVDWTVGILVKTAHKVHEKEIMNNLTKDKKPRSIKQNKNKEYMGVDSNNNLEMDDDLTDMVPQDPSMDLDAYSDDLSHEDSVHELTLPKGMFSTGSDDPPIPTYQELGNICFGNPGFYAVSIFQFVFAYGAMCAYAVIVGDTFPLVFRSWIGPNPSGFKSFLNTIFGSRHLVIALSTLFISFPLSLNRDIGALEKTSFISVSAIIFIIIAVIIAGGSLPPNSEFRGKHSNMFDLMGLFQSIGVISFAFVCHHNTFLILGSLNQPTTRRFRIVTHISTSISLMLCLVLATSGYVIFGDKAQGNILNNFPGDNILINMCRLAFGANMFLTFPLECLVCREVIAIMWHRRQADKLRNSLNVNNNASTEILFNADNDDQDIPNSIRNNDIPLNDIPNNNTNHNDNAISDNNQNIETSDAFHYITTTLLVFSALIIAEITCDLGAILEASGGLSASALAFILPPLFYMKIEGIKFSFNDQESRKYIICMGFGLFVLIIAIANTILSLFNGEEKTCI